MFHDFIQLKLFLNEIKIQLYTIQYTGEKL